MVAAKLELVVDCTDADLLADFWAAAPGYERYGSSGPYRSLVDPYASRPS